MDLDTIIKLVISLLACFAAAGIGSVFTIKAIPNWYAGLKKPRYTPPNRSFGPVWTVLYILMGVAIFLVWREGLDASGVLLAFSLFWGQLALNAFWSAVFFGLKSRGGGVITIIALWLFILATMLSFWAVSPWAGALLVPYLVWVSIASYLNTGVWLLNRSSSPKPAG